ncbi:MAG: CO dehydrogenase/acetyl-CoA synthase subunit delta [Candidatus Methanospirareceae archaeon]
MAKELKVEDIIKILDKYGIVELEDIEIKGDIDLDLSISTAEAAASASSVAQYAQILGQGVMQVALVLLNIAKSMGYPVENVLQQYIAPAAPPAPPIEELEPAKFEVGKEEYVGKIQEVTLGATSKDGGTRDHTITIGGETVPPFYTFQAPMPHPIVVTVDTFDMPIGLAKAVKMHYEDVMNDPGEWAKKVVEKYNADMVTIHLISTDPYLKDTPPKEATKAVEEVLQAVKVPIVIGGSGNPEKDPAVLEAAAEAAAGERCLIASANLNMDYERIAKATIKHGHVILSWTQLNMTDQKTLNKHLLGLGVKREDLIMDPTTAALGYGLEYAFTNIERIRLAALKGDEDLTFPISCGVTNAWGAREAWMVESPIPQDTTWGPRELRGPLYEIITGYVLCLAGADMMMMMHPEAAAAVKEVTMALMGKVEGGEDIPVADWVTFTEDKTIGEWWNAYGGKK